jgi:hypothetical protein
MSSGSVKRMTTLQRVNVFAPSFIEIAMKPEK